MSNLCAHDIRRVVSGRVTPPTHLFNWLEHATKLCMFLEHATKGWAENLLSEDLPTSTTHTLEAMHLSI